MKNEDLIKMYSELDLKKLPEVIKKNGIEYKLLTRTESKSIYQQIGTEYFEVFKTKITKYRENLKNMMKLRPDPNFDEKNYPEYSEKFPGDEDFGAWAWAYSKLDDAKKRYEALS